MTALASVKLGADGTMMVYDETLRPPMQMADGRTNGQTGDAAACVCVCDISIKNKKMMAKKIEREMKGK